MLFGELGGGKRKISGNEKSSKLFIQLIVLNTSMSQTLNQVLVIKR